MKNWYVITGRMAFDDEDTCIAIEAITCNEVVDKFRKYMWESNRNSEFLIENPLPPEHPEEDEDIIYVISMIRCVDGRKPEIIQTG